MGTTKKRCVCELQMRDFKVHRNNYSSCRYNNVKLEETIGYIILEEAHFIYIKCIIQCLLCLMP